jgi:hypothetical protein
MVAPYYIQQFLTPATKRCSLGVNSGGLNTGGFGDSLLGRIWPAFGDPSEMSSNSFAK